MHGTLRLSCCKTISVMSVSARAALSSSEAPPVIAVAHTAGNAVCAATPPSATTDGEIPARSRAAVASFLSQLSEEDLRSLGIMRTAPAARRPTRSHKRSFPRQPRHFRQHRPLRACSRRQLRPALRGLRPARRSRLQRRSSRRSSTMPAFAPSWSRSARHT